MVLSVWPAVLSGHVAGAGVPELPAGPAALLAAVGGPGRSRRPDRIPEVIRPAATAAGATRSLRSSGSVPSRCTGALPHTSGSER